MTQNNIWFLNKTEQEEYVLFLIGPTITLGEGYDAHREGQLE